MKKVYCQLYILSCDDKKYLKIGVCKEENIYTRIKNLQTGNPHKINLEFVEYRPNATKAEKYLHNCFQDYQTEGEWFSGITVNDIRVKLMLFLSQE